MRNKAQIRYNPLTGKSVIFAPNREKRPNDTKKEGSQPCPFCPENLSAKRIKGRLPASGAWQTAAVDNVFPVLSRDKDTYGYQEVIIDSAKHHESFSELSVKQIEAVLRLFQIRNKELAKNKKINYILGFKNQGKAAGASLRHIHSQIFASSILPPDIIEERNRIASYQQESGRCPFCDLAKEERNGPRLIYEDSQLIAFCPFASEFPYEVWLLNRRHVDNITLMKPLELSSLAKALKMIAMKLKDLNYDFNFFMHNDIANPYQHFYIKIQPRPTVWAGIELGSGLIINPVTPEKAAKYYNK